MHKIRCEFCNQEINSVKIKRFCNYLCQRKHYNRRPEIREKYRLRMKEYRRTHPEWKEKHRLMQARYKERRQAYWKEYGKRPNVVIRIKEKRRWKLKNDLDFAIADRLRRSLNHALNKYSTTGKIMSSRKYGLNWKEIIDSLKPFPKELGKYEVDHIRPLHSFNLTNPDEVKIAFSPSNLQWLTREENRKKSGKIINS